MKITKEKMLRNTSAGLPLRIRPVFEDFHRLKVNEEYNYPIHKHTSYELIVVDRGPYRCLLNDERIILSYGEFLIIKPGDIHQDLFRPGQDHYVLHFSLQASDNIKGSIIQLFDSNIKPELQVGTEALGDPFSFFKRLQNELITDDVFSTYVQDSMLETFFWQLIRLLPQETLSGQFRQLSRQLEFHTKLQDLFHKKYQTNLTVTEMAREFAMSERTLAYRCKELINQTPSKAFTEFRINKATELLQSSNISIQEASDEMGYENPFHFSRVFKSVMDCSPKQYRERA